MSDLQAPVLEPAGGRALAAWPEEVGCRPRSR